MINKSTPADLKFTVNLEAFDSLYLLIPSLYYYYLFNKYYPSIHALRPGVQRLDILWR